MKQGQCICPLSWSVHCNFTGEGKCNERGWACTPTLTSQDWFYPHHWMYARKQRLQLCVLCGLLLLELMPGSTADPQYNFGGGTSFRLNMQKKSVWSVRVYLCCVQYMVHGKGWTMEFPLRSMYILSWWFWTIQHADCSACCRPFGRV